MKIELKPWYDSHRSSLMYAGIGAITLLGLFLRAYHLGSQGLWADEAFSLWGADRPFFTIWPWLSTHDAHPPLYYMLLNLCLGFGRDEIGLRLLSVIAAALTVPVMFAMGRRLAGVRCGMISALLMAVSPFNIRYAQEARMYALLTCFISLSILALVYILTEDRAGFNGADSGNAGAEEKSGSTRRYAYWAAFVVFAAAAMLCHNASVLYPLALNAFALAVFAMNIIMIRFYRSKTRFAGPHLIFPFSFKQWVAAQIGILLLWLPWLPSFLLQLRAVSGRFWIDMPSVDLIVYTIQELAGVFFMINTKPILLYGLLYGFLICLGIWSFRQRPLIAGLMASLFSLPVLAEIIISLKRPIFLDRTLIWTTVPLYVLVAAGINRLPGRILVAAGLAAVIAVSSISAGIYYADFKKEQWGPVAEIVAKEARDGDIVLINSNHTRIVFEYYFKRFKKNVVRKGFPFDLYEEYVVEPVITAEDIKHLNSILKGYRRVWLIYSHDLYSDPHRMIKNFLDRELEPAARHKYVEVELYLYKNPKFRLR